MTYRFKPQFMMGYEGKWCVWHFDWTFIGKMMGDQWLHLWEVRCSNKKTEGWIMGQNTSQGKFQFLMDRGNTINSIFHWVIHIGCTNALNCCVCGFKGLWADNIALVGVWWVSGGALLVCCLVFTCATGTAPHGFFNNFQEYATLVPAFLLVPESKRVQNRI